MPGSMFEDVVCPRGKMVRRWYSLPLSFVAHTAVLGLIVVIPLLATDVLPTPRSLLSYTSLVDPMPVVPVPTAVMRHLPQPVVPDSSLDAAPLEAPTGIAPQNSLIAEPGNVGVPGVIEGLPSNVTIDAPPAPLLPKPVETSAPVRISSGIAPPVRIKDVAPVYPPIAQSARVQGDVIIEATIGADGRVQDARVLRSVPLLDQAALDAVRAWEYRPTALNGRPVAVIMTVTVRFRLN